MIQQFPIEVYPKELKAGSQTDICIPIFNTALFTAAKCGSIHQQMDKQNSVYAYNEILFSLKKQENLDTCYNMDDLYEYFAK